ncbi:LexA family transcriptional regulator [Nitrospina gracilis]|uniref:LexA family transcriptional regulator n=1 Tax=Nitrospina gracilis TaxID=35801 RepID=UPI001F426C94|nr:helix-turn-helix transcriptional regulator [Nitrospina gracilis]MCF8719254.1 phage repressor protein C with HTH and peptisase S24 domain [Nitrospina gracilis Nb-211]
MNFKETWRRVQEVTGFDRQTQLAEFLGIGPASVTNAKRADSFPSSWALKIGEKWGVNTDWILTGKGQKYSKEGVRESHEAFNDQDLSGFIFVPQYDVKAAAGNGIDIQSEYVVDYLAFKKAWVKKKLNVSPGKLVLINVSGDSMEPTLKDDDLILIDTGIREFKKNALYVLNLGGELQVKRIEYVPGGDLIIKSDNPAYTPFTARGEQKDLLIIVGQVVWFGRQI